MSRLDHAATAAPESDDGNCRHIPRQYSCYAFADTRQNATCVASSDDSWSRLLAQRLCFGFGRNTSDSENGAPTRGRGRTVVPPGR
jgi:hypothetical protein